MEEERMSEWRRLPLLTGGRIIGGVVGRGQLQRE